MTSAIPNSPRPTRRRLRRKFVVPLLVALVLIPIAVGTFDPTAKTDGTAPISADAASESNRRAAIDNLWAAEGRISAVNAADRSITVNGFTFVLPDPVYATGPNAGKDIDIGDPKAPSGEAITWEEFTGAARSPVGFTVIAEGTYTVETATGGQAFARFVPAHVFVEETENVIAGVVSHNRVAPDAHPGLYVNGVRIVAETDPRFAPSNSFTDLGGNAIELHEIPEGTIVIAEGAFDALTGMFRARVIEAEFLAPRGGTDSVAITRAEARTSRGELRVEGAGSDPSQTITIYVSRVAGETCAQIVARNMVVATNVPIDPADGTWSFRGRGLFSPLNPIRSVCAVSTGGGQDEANTTIRT